MEIEEKNKIERLQKYMNHIKKIVYFGKYEKYVENYCNDVIYVASLSNGTDYYFKDNNYISLDKNNTFRLYDNNKHFLLNEVANKNTQFKYITPKETNKILKELESDFTNVSVKDNIFKKHNQSFDKFINYIEKIDYDISIYNKNFSIFIDIQKLRNEVIRDIESKSKKHQEMGIGDL